MCVSTPIHPTRTSMSYFANSQNLAPLCTPTDRKSLPTRMAAASSAESTADSTPMASLAPPPVSVAASSSQEIQPEAPASASLRDSSRRGSEAEASLAKRNSREDFRKAITDVQRAVVVTQEIVNVASIRKPMLKFLVVRQLGAGMHSTVQLVQRKQDSRLLVIKRWTKSQPEALREAKMLKALRHPNIVRVHEYFTDPATQQLCIVMDFATQGDLQCRIDKAKETGEVIPDEYALRILVQLCLAASHIHSRGIMHRDIKPANVFIAETPHRESGGGGDVLAYLGDFSVSTQLSGAIDLASTITGTPYYLAPEIVRGEPYGVKSDIWSIGVVLYVMLTLELPFRASSLPALARLITDTEAPLPRERDAQLMQSVRMCLAKDADTRPSAATVLRLPAMQMMRRRYTSRKLRQTTVSKLSPVWQMSPDTERRLSDRECRENSRGGTGGGASSVHSHASSYDDEALDALVVAELEDCMHEFGHSPAEHSHLPPAPAKSKSERSRANSGDRLGGPDVGSGGGGGGALNEQSTSTSERTWVVRQFGRRASAETLVERKLRTTSIYTDATPASPRARPEGERFASRTTATTNRSTAATSAGSPNEARGRGRGGGGGPSEPPLPLSPERQQTPPPPPTFDLALLYFSCGNRSRAGNLYVTATHLAFIPLLSGRRISIHLERVQCLVKSRPWALLPGEGRSLQVVLQPPLGLGSQEPSRPGDADGGPNQGRKSHRANRNISERFHGFWSREAVVAAILSATAARGMKVSVYKQRRLSVVHRKQPALSLIHAAGDKRGSMSLASAVTAVRVASGIVSRPASARKGSSMGGSSDAVATSSRGGGEKATGSGPRGSGETAKSGDTTPASSTRKDDAPQLPGTARKYEEAKL